jgi:glycosyltransferase involved in cell wall biosynthesis
MHSKAAAIQTQDVFDLLQVEGIEMAGYIAQSSSSRTRPVVFDDHNAEYVLQRTAFESDIRNPARWHGALYSFIQTRKLVRYERTICRRANRVVAASRTDAHALAALAPEIEVRVIPNGVDTTCFAPPEGTPATSSGLGSSLVYTGKMDFRPNVDAMTWFCRDILPRIRAVVPLAHLDIVGQSPSPPVLALRSPHVNVTGWVPDTRPYLSQAAVCVVPLRMGSGTRLKVLEAMAMGRAIVSTTRGIEGIGCLPGRDLLVADSPDSFASAVVELLQNPAKRRALGLAARALAVSQYDWKQIVPAFEQIYSDLLPEHRAAIM